MPKTLMAVSDFTWFHILLLCINFHMGCSENEVLVQCLMQQRSCNYTSKLPSKTEEFCGCAILKTFLRNGEEKILTFLCRTSKSLSFSVNRRNPTDFVAFTSDKLDGFAPVIIILGQNESVYTLDGLQPNEQYLINAIRMSTNDSTIYFSYFSISTLNDDYEYIPPPVVNVYENKWESNGSFCKLHLGWTPNVDFTCYYDFVWHYQQDISKKEVRHVDDLYSIILDKLSYDSNYTLLATALVNNGDFISESAAYIFKFKTPSCLSLSDNDLQICVPQEVKNLSAREGNVAFKNGTFTCDVLVSWQRLFPTPEKIIIQLITKLEAQPEVEERWTKGNTSTTTFRDKVLGKNYKIVSWAVSAAGAGPKVQLTRSLAPQRNYSFGEKAIKITLTIVIVVVILILLIGVRCQQCGISNKTKGGKELTTSREILRTVANRENCNLSTGLQFSRDDITLENILGEGAFGIVREGTLLLDGKRKKVAIKSLREKSTIEEREQFMQEIQMLQSIGSHPFIVSLLGCVTTNHMQDFLLIVEYCAFGDLQRYLHQEFTLLLSKSVPNFKDLRLTSSFDLWSNPTTKGVVVNKLYDELSEIGAGYVNIISTKDLISFAWQVAEGMDFLSANRIIHRDLAARNILLTDEKNAKISDFGLSRDVYESNFYVKKGEGKVPLKWMALESILHQKYTTQSDVWSFGVLFWEIMTFGSVPYDGISSQQLVKLLASGERLPCPDNTKPELYDLMLSCWRLNPGERPRFSDLKKSLVNHLDQLL